MRSRFVGRVALALALPLAVAACSGDEGGPGGEKARYIEQSDAICRDTFQKVSGLTARDRETAERASQEWGGAADSLKGIPQPEESVELARQFVTDVENISLSYVAAARALELNNQDKANKAFEDVAMIKKRSAEVADDYGYVECKKIDRS